MKNRINYMGGASQVARMNAGKLETLKKALVSSYQAATAILSSGKEFRCLMNPNKLNLDEEEKIISIPFEDMCLNTKKMDSTNLKAGDVFKWKEQKSHWIVLLNKDEETAYCRAICRRCRTEVEINGIQYWVYIKGPAEQSMSWSKGGNISFNNLNYTLTMFITKDENTKEFFKRFKKIKINGDNWEVQAIDSISSEGLIEVALKEDYNNNFENIETVEQENNDVEDINEPYLKGNDTVKPFDIVEYSAEELDLASNYVWTVSNNKAAIKNSFENKVVLEIVSGRSGSFTLQVKCGETVLKKDIEILSL